MGSENNSQFGGGGVWVPGNQIAPRKKSPSVGHQPRIAGFTFFRVLSGSGFSAALESGCWLD